METASVHPSPYSGSWYPDDAAELSALLDGLFAESQERTGTYLHRQGLAFVVPHAGLAYSGSTAAAAYRQLGAARPTRVIILGFPHHGIEPGLWIPAIDAFRTPLGETALDRDAILDLLEHPEFAAVSERALCDHSVEIQLPFLQRVAPQAKVVPIYVSGLDGDMRERAAKILSRLLEPGAVMLASSDLTHYGRSFHFQPFPPDECVSDRLRDMDHSTLEAAGSLDETIFFQTIRRTSTTVCGYEPIGLLLAILRRRDGRPEIYQEVLDYRTSGEITGDFRHSVSYGAAGYFPEYSFDLAAEDGELLLESARLTLENYFETGARTPVPPREVSPALDRRCGAFVSLHKDGALRGCVGRPLGGAPLRESVPSLALAAALEDSRFEPVSRSERNLEIEISILSPMKRLADPNRLRAGVHGGLLEAGFRRGLLLPQVAGERGWTARQFLDALAWKAGTKADVYQDPATRLSVFRAQVIKA